MFSNIYKLVENVDLSLISSAQFISIPLFQFVTEKLLNVITKVIFYALISVFPILKNILVHLLRLFDFI